MLIIKWIQIKHKMFIIQQKEIEAACRSFLHTSLQTKMMIAVHSSQVVESHLQNCMLG